MKPTKNQVFCYGCHRTKMLFDTQSKAENFIRFNQESILEENGKAPVRSYYCRFCFGYHVTSNPSREYGEILDQTNEKQIQDLVEKNKKKKTEKESKNQINAIVSTCLNLAKGYVLYGMFNKARETILDGIKNIEVNFSDLYSDIYLQGTTDTLRRQLKDIDNIITISSLTSSDKESIISQYDPKNQEIIITGLHNHVIVEDLEHTLSEIDKLLEVKEIDNIDEKLEHCDSLLTKLRIKGYKKQLRDYNNRILDQGKRKKQILTGLKELEPKAVVSNPLTDKQKKKKEEEYRSTLLSLINRIELITESFNNGDYFKTRNLIDAGFVLLDDMGGDDNIRLIKKQFDYWDNRVNNEL